MLRAMPAAAPAMRQASQACQLPAPPVNHRPSSLPSQPACVSHAAQTTSPNQDIFLVGGHTNAERYVSSTPPLGTGAWLEVAPWHSAPALHQILPTVPAPATSRPPTVPCITLAALQFRHYNHNTRTVKKYLMSSNRWYPGAGGADGSLVGGCDPTGNLCGCKHPAYCCPQSIP